jgi:hypothetical protein
LYSVFESSHPASSQSPRYLCAACTCGQAIFTALVGEDGSSPAETLPAAGEFEPFRAEFKCIEERDGAPD